MRSVVARALRSVPRWLGVAVAAVSMMTCPVWASPDDGGDVGSKLDDFLGKVKTRVIQTAEKHPEWARYIPRNPSSNPVSMPQGRPGGPQMPWSLPDVGLPTGRGVSAGDLDRVLVGYQAGVLKIVGSDGRVLFIKHRVNSSSDMVGIDSVEYAPVDEGQRHEILSALRLGDGEAAAGALMRDYGRLPKTKALAVLGVVAAGPVSPNCAARIRAFLVGRLREGDVKIHRMAVLALAIANETDERTTHSVIDFMDCSTNSWETFTTQQFFQYHRDEIRSYMSAIVVRQRLAHSRNPYGPSIAANF